MNRVLVTGGAGFLGSHLCERLLQDGNKTTEDIARSKVHPDRVFLRRIHHRLHVILGQNDIHVFPRRAIRERSTIHFHDDHPLHILVYHVNLIISQKACTCYPFYAFLRKRFTKYMPFSIKVLQSQSDQAPPTPYTRFGRNRTASGKNTITTTTSRTAT